VVEDLLAALDDPALPLLQWGDRFSAAATRLPAPLADQLEVGQQKQQR
jgi:Acetyl-CoA carboxylase, central region